VVTHFLELLRLPPVARADLEYETAPRNSRQHALEFKQPKISKVIGDHRFRSGRLLSGMGQSLGSIESLIRDNWQIPISGSDDSLEDSVRFTRKTAPKVEPACVHKNCCIYPVSPTIVHQCFEMISDRIKPVFSPSRTTDRNWRCA
jgi:hypothetical protein